jgi:hypothetical protein
MTLLLTEIHCLDGLFHSCIVFAADRRISSLRNSEYVYAETRKKIFKVPYLQAGVGFFGLAEAPINGSTKPMSDWLERFIQRNSHLASMKTFASALANSLNVDIPLQRRKQNISGFHLAGYNITGLPEFWYVRNVDDDRSTITGTYEVREDFLHRDAAVLGYDGQNPHSVHTGLVQIYRNGDIRAHVTSWEKIEEGFGTLLKEPQFKKLKTISDSEQWVRFKMEIVAYFYKNYCRESLAGRPIDTISIEGRST